MKSSPMRLRELSRSCMNAKAAPPVSSVSVDKQPSSGLYLPAVDETPGRSPFGKSVRGREYPAAVRQHVQGVQIPWPKRTSSIPTTSFRTIATRTSEPNRAALLDGDFEFPLETHCCVSGEEVKHSFCRYPDPELGTMMVMSHETMLRSPDPERACRRISSACSNSGESTRPAGRNSPSLSNPQKELTCLSRIRQTAGDAYEAGRRSRRSPPARADSGRAIDARRIRGSEPALRRGYTAGRSHGRRPRRPAGLPLRYRK